MKADSLNVKSLLKSKEGIHISIYMPQPHSDLNFKQLLEAALKKCTLQIGDHLTEDKLKELLGPLQALMNNPRMISEFNSNVAIFRTAEYMRLLSLPVNTGFSVHVADSFHVKPLLSYINQDYQFLFFGTNGNKGYLYKGTKKSFQLIEEFHFHNTAPLIKNSRLKKKINMSWAVQAISKIDNYDHHIFISANASETKTLRKSLDGRNLYWRNVSKKYNMDQESTTMQTIQQTLNMEKELSTNYSLVEFDYKSHTGADGTRLSYDLNEISKAAKQGHVKKLLVASDAFIFGRIDDTTGEVTFHENDKDCTDDDLLDDISQNVFKTGGEIFIVPKKLIPQNEFIIGAIKDFSPIQKNIVKKELLIA